MKTSDKTILVTGATGKQGGAVACHLLADGWNVRALTRDPGKPASRELEKSGAELVTGSLDERSSLNRAVRGVYGVYSVQTFMEQGIDAEILQGKLLADVAKTAGVEHFVYSSVIGANRSTGVPHFESKWLVEEFIRTINLPATVVRPTFFMENFVTVPEWHDEIFEGRLVMALAPETKLPMIAVNDIGAIVAMAFRRPDEFKGCAVDIAGDVLSGPQIAEAFSVALERPVGFEELPIADLRKMNPDFAKMFAWFNATEPYVDIDSLRVLHPGLQSFSVWLKEKTWSVVHV